MLRLPILDMQKKFPNATLYDQIGKLEEEVEEVREAETLEDTVRETLDLIQAAIGVLEMLEGTVDLKAMNVDHLKKLADRHWKFKAMLNIEREDY